MEEKKLIIGNNVSETLFIPLVARLKGNKMYPRYFTFHRDQEMAKKIDLSTMQYDMGVMTVIGTGLRECMLIEETKEYLKTYPEATVVNIGCGLDSIFEYVDNGKITFYNMDLPDVMELRKDLIPTMDREHDVAMSFLDDEFLNFFDYNPEKGIIFLMSGVVYYFEVPVIEKFIQRLAEHFPNGRLCFDAAPERTNRINQKRLAKMGMTDVTMPFALKDPMVMKTWSDHIASLDINYKWFDYLPDTKDFSFFHKMAGNMMSWFKAMYRARFDFK